MINPCIKQSIHAFFSSQSIVHLIQIYIECLGYLFPVLITYLYSKSIKTTLFMLAIVIFLRFMLSFYYLKKSIQKPSLAVRYSFCHKGHEVDEIEKIKMIKDSQMKYQEFRRRQAKVSSEQKSIKQNEIQLVAKQLQDKELTIIYKWD